ncbi:MAG: L,D-transpeptidase [Desulfuromonadales bacterium]|nr:L,D-transpeptidase [Desulfuromonadales bacterium]
MARLNFPFKRSATSSSPDDLTPPRRRLGTLHRRSAAALIVGAVVLCALEGVGWLLAGRSPAPAAVDGNQRLRAMQSENARLRQKIAALAPKGVYVVIDTAGNRVYLRQGDETLKEMLASCGSGNVLEDPAGGRTWTFDTPRGEFRIQSKISKPIWIKPDWAFIEEGEPIPKRHAERAEPGMMGDYALGIGQGYFIHGTLYSRLLGRNVSHGCVRLGDDDLKTLVKKVSLGTRVIIF